MTVIIMESDKDHISSQVNVIIFVTPQN